MASLQGTALRLPESGQREPGVNFTANFGEAAGSRRDQIVSTCRQFFQATLLGQYRRFAATLHRWSMAKCAARSDRLPQIRLKY